MHQNHYSTADLRFTGTAICCNDFEIGVLNLFEISSPQVRFGDNADSYAEFCQQMSELETFLMGTNSVCIDCEDSTRSKLRA